MKIDPQIEAFLTTSQSVKHHYIPQFFMKAFVNHEGFLWVYDKVQDKILRDKKHPRNIFYEDHYNSITINGRKMAIVELMYNGLEKDPGPDAKIHAEAIKKIQNISKADHDPNTNEIVELMLLVSQLTFRVPATEDLNRAVIKDIKEKYPDFYPDYGLLQFLEDEDRFKMERYITPTLMYENRHRNSSKTISFAKLLEFKTPFFCLSDNPIIWKNNPQQFDDFRGSQIFPLSKSKLLLFFESPEYTMKSEDYLAINIILIEQAKRYVAFSDKALLEFFVNAFQEFKKIDVPISLFIGDLFRRIEMNTER